MFLQKNGVLFKGLFNKAIAFGAALFCLSGLVSSVSATYDPCCSDQCYQDSCCFDPCNWDCPDFVFYADFLYWQVNVDGLDYATLRNNLGIDSQNQEYHLFAPDCELEPGFRLGLIVDLGCCNWDFYAQYTWLNQCIHDKHTLPFPGDSTVELIPLIDTTLNVTFDSLNLARAEWDTKFNVLDFGFGRTFAVNCCFDFRPHLGFKATWQNLRYDVRYEELINTTQANRVDIHNKIDFNGIGLRGGFDAAWRFSRCFSLVGGLAISSVWSEIDIYRRDQEFAIENGNVVEEGSIVEFKNEHCVLVPVSELLFGIRYDTTMCDCYDLFVFVGWENQVWWDLNRYIFINNEGLQHGPHGNVTYQGLVVRAGLDF